MLLLFPSLYYSNVVKGSIILFKTGILFQGWQTSNAANLIKLNRTIMMTILSKKRGLKLGSLFPANRGLSGGEKMRETRETGKFSDVPSSAVLDETKPVLKYRVFVTQVTHLLRMSKFIDCWNHCEPTWKPVCWGWSRECQSLPWDAGACSIGFLPGAGRGLSPLSHFLAAWETSVSREGSLVTTKLFH